MRILVRITLMAWRYKVRLILAYIAFAAAIAFAPLVPRIFGDSIDSLVLVEDGAVVPQDVAMWGIGGLFFMAALLLGASLMRGFSDFGRT